MEQNICCGDGKGVTIENATIYVNCCCKCGNNGGGDKPAPPTPEEPEKKYRIMTVKVDLSNSDPATCCSYADDAVGMTAGSAAWDEFFGHYPVMFKEGKEVGKLNPNDFTKFVNGTSADITSGVAGDVMIAFPRRGLKIETVGNIMTVSMTDDPDNPDFEYLAHVRGEERREVFYLGAYAGYVADLKLRSLSGKMPALSQTIGEFRARAQANGLGYKQSGFYQLTLRQAMYILKYKHLDPQFTVGVGYSNGTSPINTGGTETNGMDWGEITGKLHAKLFGIEDAIGNVHEWFDGVAIDRSSNILTATDHFNDGGEGYLNQGYSDKITLGFVNKVQGTTKRGFIADKTSGTATTYFCGKGSLNSSSVALGGGSYMDGRESTFLSLDIAHDKSKAYANTGARLMYL